MTEAKYTPGPWKASLDMDGRHHALSILTENEAFKEEEWPYHPLIARVHHGLGHADRKTAEATARLIQAAPDLLEALKRAVACIRSAGDVSHENDCMCVVHEALKAIAKAEGQLK